jgi:hypothetical protein
MRRALRVACTLSGVDLRAQAARWQELVREAGLGRVETDNGLQLAFRDEPAVADELLALVDVENECCAWASWTVAREDGQLVMQAASTGQGVATLHSMFTA